MADQTVTTKGKHDLGSSSPQSKPLGSKMVFASVVGPTSYATGGMAITAAEFGLTSLLGVVCLSGTGLYSVQYDVTNGKLGWFVAAVEVSNSADIDAITCQVIAFGN